MLSTFASVWPFSTLLLRKYRDRVRQQYSAIELPFRKPLTTRDVLVPLKLLDGSEETIYDPDLLAMAGSAIVLGPPGSGKTVLLKKAMLDWADGRTEGDSVPIYVPLANKERGEDLMSLASREFQTTTFGDTNSLVKALAIRGKITFLLDGLDEIADERRDELRKEIHNCRSQYPDVAIVVTCRAAVYRNKLFGMQLARYEVLEFDRRQIQRAIEPWRKDLLQVGRSPKELFEALEQRPSILQLAQNPLLLTMMVHLYSTNTEGNYELPNHRYDFFGQATQLLLETWHEGVTKPGYRRHIKEAFLAELAREARDSRGGDAITDPANSDASEELISFDTTLSVASRTLSSFSGELDGPMELIEEVVTRSGVLLELDGAESYQFSHRSLREFFLARQVGGNLQLLRTKLSENYDAWRETTRLCVSQAGRDEGTSAFIQELARADLPLAIECLADSHLTPDMIAESILSDATHRLVDDTSVASSFSYLVSCRGPTSEIANAMLRRTVDENPRTRLAGSALDCLAAARTASAAEFIESHLDSHPDGPTSSIPLLLSMGRVGSDSIAGHTIIDDRKFDTLKEHDLRLTIELLGEQVQESSDPSFARRLAEMVDRDEVLEVLDDVEVEEPPTFQDAWNMFDLSENASKIGGWILYRLANDSEWKTSAAKAIANWSPSVALPLILAEDRVEMLADVIPLAENEQSARYEDWTRMGEFAGSRVDRRFWGRVTRIGVGVGIFAPIVLGLVWLNSGRAVVTAAAVISLVVFPTAGYTMTLFMMEGAKGTVDKLLEAAALQSVGSILVSQRQMKGELVVEDLAGAVLIVGSLTVSGSFSAIALFGPFTGTLIVVCHSAFTATVSALLFRRFLDDRNTGGTLFARWVVVLRDGSLAKRLRIPAVAAALQGLEPAVAEAGHHGVAHVGTKPRR